MQAALLIRQKQTLRKKKGRRHELPSNVATKDIAPFPTYPPQAWSLGLVASSVVAGKQLLFSSKVSTCEPNCYCCHPYSGCMLSRPVSSAELAWLTE
ncbi:hypothetical protein B566_EDAN011354 [Ephemera danica]|nr:hypothetical protein B566_EDAN011354 [Ephemera danica]